MEIVYIFLAGLAVMFASLSGVFFISTLLKDKVDKNLPYLLSFSAGIFLITAFFLALESTHLLSGYVWSGVLVIAGFIGAWLISKLMPETHHHHDACCDGHKKDRGTRILIGDSIHNIADGLVIASTFIVSPVLGLGVTISILVHEFLQEISEFFVLKSAGFSNKKALSYNFLTSSTILIGIVIGIFFVNTVTSQGVILAISAGFLFYIVSKDLLPHNHKVEGGKEMFQHLAILTLGLLLMFGVINSFEHSHEGHDQEHNTHEHDEHVDDEHGHEDHDEHENNEEHDGHAEHHDEH